MQVVPSPCTAREALALTIKHLKTLGIPFAHDILRCTMKGLINPQNNFFIYADCTDAGPEQVARRKMLRSALADIGHVLYFDCNCIIHQYHLIVKESLLLIDKVLLGWRDTENACRGNAAFGKYFASAAKLANYWREHVDEFIQKYEAIHTGAEKSSMPYRRFPLKVVGGRWGSIDQAESFYLERGKKLLQPVLMAVLSSSMKAEKKADTLPAGDDPMDLQDDLDARQGYQLQMSKWASGVWARCKCRCGRGPSAAGWSQASMLFVVLWLR